MCSVKFFILVVCSTFEWHVCASTFKDTRNVETENCKTPPAIVNGKVDCEFSDVLQLEMLWRRWAVERELLMPPGTPPHGPDAGFPHRQTLRRHAGNLPPCVRDVRSTENAAFKAFAVHSPKRQGRFASTPEERFCTYTCNTGYRFLHISESDMVYPCDVSTGFYDKIEPDQCGPSCNPPCLNGGECVAPNTCMCKPPFYGEQCLYSRQTCTSSVTPRFGSLDCTPDANGGKACIPKCLPTFIFETAAPEKYVCSKDGTWTPDINTVPDCIKDRCNVSCLNGGVCTGPNTCNCTPPYSGDHCQTFALVTGVSSQRN